MRDVTFYRCFCFTSARKPDARERCVLADVEHTEASDDDGDEEEQVREPVSVERHLEAKQTIRETGPIK